mmetsp:Transcript_47864/g.119849  ORF Transcript_47864/g.119849 Transcript_47864/m.119849 type:complete len:352 (+) Transcript_47864:475-1530(+)
MDEKPVTAKRRRSARGTTAPARTTRKADTGPPKPLPPPVPAAAEQPGAKTRRPRKNKKEPMCKVQGCNESVANMKTLNLRYRICDFHAKAPVVMQDGEQLRFCQQCSRLHPVEDFDNNKRSCRFKLDLIGQRRKTRIASELQKMGHLRGAAGAGTSRAPSQALQAHHLGEDQPTSSGEPSAACGTPVMMQSQGRALPPGRSSIGQPMPLKSGTSLISRPRTQPALRPPKTGSAQQDLGPYDIPASELDLDFFTSNTTSQPTSLGRSSMINDLHALSTEWLPEGDQQQRGHPTGQSVPPPPLERQPPIQQPDEGTAHPTLLSHDSVDLSILSSLLPISPGSFMPDPNQPRPW